ncbi:MAG TPA: chorismate synthase, partial [Thermomicrobiales bacterium]|nr:chorismate synthase [Thermomicrobiales bacterium]
MSSSFGTIFRLTTWGESHGPALGVVVEGCPAGIPISRDEIQAQLERRRVGQSKVTTPRGEMDYCEILSGIFEGVTTGAPISLVTYNKDADSSKYENLREVFRPGHADYTYWAKYGHRDHRGGGRSSARETWGRVAAGAIARKILAHYQCEVYGFVR